DKPAIVLKTIAWAVQETTELHDACLFVYRVHEWHASVTDKDVRPGVDNFAVWLVVADHRRGADALGEIAGVRRAWQADQMARCVDEVDEVRIDGDVRTQLERVADPHRSRLVFAQKQSHITAKGRDAADGHGSSFVTRAGRLEGVALRCRMPVHDR